MARRGGIALWIPPRRMGIETCLVFFVGRVEVENLFVAALVEILFAQGVHVFRLMFGPVVGNIDGQIESLTERLFRGFV